MSSDETTPSPTVRRKRRWRLLLGALLVLAIVAYATLGGQRPQKFVGIWEVSGTESEPNASTRRYEFDTNGAAWMYVGDARSYAGTWDGTENELIITMQLASNRQGTTTGVVLEWLAQLMGNQAGWSRSIKFSVAGAGDVFKLTPTEEFGGPPSSPQEITIKRLAK